LRQHFFNLSEA